MSDLISRQDAINTSLEFFVEFLGGALHENAQKELIARFQRLSSAQPEIIRCNACKHWTQTTGNMRGFGLGDCDYINAKLVNCNGFCYWAERRG